MPRSHMPLRGPRIALIVSVAALTATPPPLAHAAAGDCGVQFVKTYPAGGATIAASAPPPIFTFTTNLSSAPVGLLTPGKLVLGIPNYVIITDAHGGIYDSATAYSNDETFQATFTGSRGVAWWKFPGTYYVEFLGGGTQTSGAVVCFQSAWPVIAFTIAGPPSVTPPVPTPPSERSPTRDLTFFEANRAAAQLVHLRAPGGSRLMRACTRRSPARFRCGMNWRDRRYRWKGIATFTALDAKTIDYRFLGSRTRIKCRTDCTRGVLWESG